MVDGAYYAEAAERASQLSGEVSEAILDLSLALREGDEEAAERAARALESASGHALSLSRMCREAV